MEPYAQLVRSLLPRAASVSLFDNTGKLLWTSAQSSNSDLFALVLAGLAQVESDRDGVGQHCALPGDGPAYLFWLRDTRGNVAAVVAVVCTKRAGDADLLPFSYVHDHLKPALELLGLSQRYRSFDVATGDKQWHVIVLDSIQRKAPVKPARTPFDWRRT